jgi:Dolichyl-phosphate-mannose-protein mannosyltransferase
MRRHGLLALVLVVAVLLRFTALGWGLRHLPHNDERAFVESVAEMLAAGDLNHRFPQYPGLFSYLLAAVLAFLPAPQTTPAAYLAARAVNASFGVLSVLLVYVLGRRLAGESGGLFAAALLAVSPPEVRTAHMVRPDVTLHAFVLLALLAFERLGPRLRGDLVSGAAIGAATAVKFSAPLVAPCYLVRRLTAEGFRWWKPLAAAALALAVFAVLSPYTFLAADSQAGLVRQFAFHYRERPGTLDYGDTAVAYGRIVLTAVGPIGLLLAFVGTVVCRRGFRETLPLAILPLSFVAVFSSAGVHHERFLIPSLGAVCVLAGAGVEVVARWRAPAGAALAILALVSPSVESLDYVRAVSGPTNKDLGVAWIEAHYPRGARVVVTAATDLGLDPARFEKTSVPFLRTADPLLLGEQDLIVAGLRDRHFRPGLTRIQAIHRDTPWAGDHVILLAPGAAERRRYVAIDLATARLSASGGDDGLVAIRDGDPKSAWRVPMAEAAFLEIRFREPTPLARVEIVPGDSPASARAVEVLGLRPTATSFERLRVVDGRPSLAAQLPPRSQVLVLGGTPIEAVRLRPVGTGPGGWSVAELELARLP